MTVLQIIFWHCQDHEIENILAHAQITLPDWLKGQMAL